MAIFRPSTGYWNVLDLTNMIYGMAGDYPVPGDYDFNRKTDIAIFRPSDTSWRVRQVTTFYFGDATGIPCPGDYNGDGKTDGATFEPTTFTWKIRNITNVTYGSVAGSIPVAGDYDGDGTTKISVWVPSSGTWYIQGHPSVSFGSAGDHPFAFDYEGDGTQDRAVYRGSNSSWYVYGVTLIAYGADADLPAPGDYKGRGNGSVFGVFRQSDTTWRVYDLTSKVFGALSDQPLYGPASAAPSPTPLRIKDFVLLPAGNGKYQGWSKYGPCTEAWQCIRDDTTTTSVTGYSPPGAIATYHIDNLVSDPYIRDVYALVGVFNMKGRYSTGSWSYGIFDNATTNGFSWQQQTWVDVSDWEDWSIVWSINPWTQQTWAKTDLTSLELSLRTATNSLSRMYCSKAYLVAQCQMDISPTPSPVSPSPTPTVTPIPTASPSPSITITPLTPTPTPPTPTPSATPTPTPMSPTPLTPSPTPTAEPTVTPSPTASPSPTAVPSATPSPSPTSAVTPSPTPTPSLFKSFVPVVDGFIENDGPIWGTVHDSASGVYVQKTIDEYPYPIGANYSAGAEMYYVNRVYISFFPTDFSAATVVDAKLYVYGIAFNECSVGVQQATVSTDITTSDFAAFSGTQWAAYNWQSGAWNEISVPTALIVEDQHIAFCLREKRFDYNDLQPDTWYYAGCRFNEYTGFSPRLDLTFGSP